MAVNPRLIGTVKKMMSKADLSTLQWSFNYRKRNEVERTEMKTAFVRDKRRERRVL